VVLGSWFLVLGSGCPHSWYAPGSRTCGRDARTPGTRRGRAHAGGTPALLARAGVAHMRAGTPAHPGCMWFSVPGSWFSVRDARAPRMHVVLGSWFLVLGSGRPRTQDARGSQFLVLGSRFGTPALPGGTWFSVPGSWFSVRDARAPRGHVVLGSRFLVLGSWFLVPGSWFLVLGSRFGTPAHPGTLSAVAPQGLPRAQRGLMDFE